MTRLTVAAWALATLIGGCSTENEGPGVFADAAKDASQEAAQAADASTDATVEQDTAEEASAPLKETALVANFDAVRELELSVFGVNKDGTLHIEAHGDAGASDCTVQQGAPPGRTLTMGAVPTTVDTHELSAVLFDFEGALTEEPLLHSEAGTISVREYSESFFWAEIDIRFAGGSISGSLYAMHCAAIDE